MTASIASQDRNFVVVTESGAEAGRYTQRGSANRAAKKLAGARTVTVAEFEAEQAAAAVVAEATEVVEAKVAEAKQVRKSRLAPASQKLALADKRSLAAWYRYVVEAALERALEDGGEQDFAEFGGSILAGCSESDIRGQVEQWLSYLPKQKGDDAVEG